MNDVTRASASDFAFPKFKTQFTEFIGIADDGHLWVDGCDCAELARTYDTPLYVISENQFRLNYRRFRGAFAAHYPNVQILFANKSNRGLAYRHIMNQEGAGGDCFGINELYVALMAGTDPATLVLNGSNKEAEEIATAVANGVCINIDAMDEVERIAAEVQRQGRPARVGIRAKLELKPLENRFGVVMHGPGSLAEQARNHKWGMTLPQSVELVKRVQKTDGLEAVELHYHLSRMSNVPDDFAVMAREMVQWSADIRDATGWEPPYLDIGGGWAFGRPEKTGPFGEDDADAPAFEDYAKAVCEAVIEECETRGLALPGLKIEPGWSISGSSGVALGRVGAVKEWPGFKKWINVDLSGNHIPPPWYHHIVAVEKADQPAVETVDIVGPLCSSDELGEHRELPALERGDLIALLDTGGYTEVKAANHNGQLRPATVLVTGADAFVTTERERLRDIVGRFRVPPHVLAASAARA